MSETDETLRSELAALTAEVAELLRFEHDVGAIGVIDVVAPPIVRVGAASVTEAVTPAAAASEPVAARVIELPKRPAAPVVAARPVEVSMGEVDALLARAKRARTKEVPPQPTAPVSPAVVSGAARLPVLDQLAKAAAGCTACRLHETRTKSVFSRGSAETEIVFVGEGPGFNEDKQGEPFVGAAGQLLDKMVSAMGFARDAVYICNVVKCRPPENRTPLPDEAAACGHFLDGQLDAVRPRVIVALGRCAAERLGCAEAGQSWRGSWGEYKGVPVMPTYHPAYLLRNAEMKRPVWEDLQKVTQRLATLRGGTA